MCTVHLKVVYDMYNVLRELIMVLFMRTVTTRDGGIWIPSIIFKD